MIDIDCEQAIIAAPLDYYEGWFDGTSDRMEQALHPQLVKRSIEIDGSIDNTSAREMIDATAATETLVRS